MIMNFEAFWAKFTQVFSFFFGCAIMAYETLIDNHEKPWLYAAAVGMMGLPIARAAEDILSKFSTHGPPAIPPPQPPPPQSSPPAQGEGETK